MSTYGYTWLRQFTDACTRRSRGFDWPIAHEIRLNRRKPLAKQSGKPRVRNRK